MINTVERGQNVTTRPGQYAGQSVIEVHGAPVNGKSWMYHHAGEVFYVYYTLPCAPQGRKIVQIRRAPDTPQARAALPYKEDVNACVKFALALIRSDQPTISMALPADRWYRPEQFNSSHPDYGTVAESEFTLIGGGKEGLHWFPANV